MVKANTMSIIRSPRPEINYTVIDNSLINNENLDWRELGILIYLLSKPDNWQVSITHLANEKGTGISGVKTAIKSLKSLGYITTRRKSNGQVDWYVFDYPQVVFQLKEKPQVEKPQVEKPHVEIQPLIRTDNKTKTEVINNTTSKSKFTPPTIEEANQFIAEKGYSFSGEEFVYFNTAKGWVIGKSQSPMKCWKSAMYTWQKNRGNQHDTRSNKTIPKQPDNSATRHHDRLKALHDEAIADELDNQTVQQVSSDIQPQMVVGNRYR